MEKIKLELPVIGVKFLPDSTKGFQDADTYRGVSYCDAVRLATYGQELLLEPGCIEVCKWSPVVLGFKAPENRFEESLEPRMGALLAGVYLAQLSRFGAGVEPDVVIIRGRPGQLRRLAEMAGEGSLQERYRGLIGRTALGSGDKGASVKALLTQGSNRALSRLRQWKRFDDFTRVAFKSHRVTGAFEKLAKNAVADMSMCRNSTVLPYTERAGNISFFCAGGVTWGGNSPATVTSGFPYGIVKDALLEVDYPGKKARP